MFKFEKLKVWEKAVDFSTKIHELTRKFPKEELYILNSQIKRAADSIALNIAEGSTGQSNAEFKQFVNYAIRSGIEVVTSLYIGRNRKIINRDDFTKYYNAVEEIIKMLHGLKSSLN